MYNIRVSRSNIPPVKVFAGKGGVGKTTCAAAAALHYASAGSKTLAISTDATPSLAHIFEASSAPTPVRVADNLYFNEIGIVEARQMWDHRFGKEVYQVFSSFVDLDYREFVDFMSSMLPGLAEEFMVDYIRELTLKGEYNIIVWDTAPLGQTLALLETPSLLSRHLRMAPRIYTKMKAGAGTREPILEIIRRWEKLSALDMEFLRTGVDFNIVAIPEALSVNQLDGIFSETGKHGFKVSRLIINNVVRSNDSDFLRERGALQKAYLDLIHGKYNGSLEITELPLFPHEIKGLPGIREIADRLFPNR